MPNPDKPRAATHCLRQVLPVIDVQQGRVVHGIGGERTAYQPIRSRLIPSSEPLEVARALSAYVGNKDLYLADLDAIAGGQPPWEMLRALAAEDFRVWLDAGIHDAPGGLRLLTEVPQARWIVGLESLPQLDQLPQLLRDVPGQQVVFSLDLKAGKPLARDPAAQQLAPEAIAALASDAGIASLIVLDLQAVGTTTGLRTFALCERLKARLPGLELISGGGVRNRQDVQRLLDAGCDRVLVATALHQGSLDAEAGV